MRSLDLDTLRTLVLASDLGGYGQAAERLGRTPSAVSLQMKRLQQDVGATLFRKEGRNLALTEIGQVVLRYGRRLLEINDEVLDIARGASLAGVVRIGFAQDFANTILPEALSRFTEHFPLVQIEVRIDKNASLVQDVENKQIDLALTVGHSDRPTAYQIGELPLVWIAGQRFRRRSEQSLALVAFEAPCLLRDCMLQALDESGIPWRIALVSPSLSGLWAGASAGLGVTVRGNLGLPEQLDAGVRLFDLPELGSLPVNLHCRRNTSSAAVDRLAEIVGELAMKVIPHPNRRPQVKLADVRMRPDPRSSQC